MTGRTTTRPGLAALVLAAAMWASTVVTIKIASRGLTVIGITLIEIAVALLVLSGALLARRTKLPKPHKALLLAGVLQPGLVYPLINLGLSRTSGTHAALIIGLESVFVVLLSAALERSYPSRRVLFAVTLTVIGVAVLTGGDSGTATPAGDFLVLAGVVAASGYVVTVQRYAPGMGPITLTFYQFLFGGLVTLLIFGPIFGLSSLAGSRQGFGHPTAGEFGAAILAGLLGSVIAFALFNWALNRTTAALAGTSSALIPVFGIALSAGFLGEPITTKIIAATSVVIIGVALTAGNDPDIVP
jgi:O-acetylserine/cysteine efflux transporter